MNSGDKKEKVPKPARIPPQTPPAGGKSAEAGRIHIPSQLFRPAESILVLLKKLLLVPGVGLEPTRLAPHDFESCMFANFIIPADIVIAGF